MKTDDQIWLPDIIDREAEIQRGKNFPKVLQDINTGVRIKTWTVGFWALTCPVHHPRVDS